MLLTHFSQCCKTYDFNVHAWNCHSVMHLCIFMHLPIFHTLGRSSWMHTSKETPPTYTIPHYFWSTFEFKGILHGYGWKESYMRFFTGTMSLQNEFFGHHGSGLGKGFHFKKLRNWVWNDISRSDDISRFSWSLTLSRLQPTSNPPGTEYDQIYSRYGGVLDPFEAI